MTGFIKKLISVQIFNRETVTTVEIETDSNLDMDEWKGWDAWVDFKK